MKGNEHRSRKIEIIGNEFQWRYTTVLEIEQLNKDLKKALHKFQRYCELALDPGMQPEG